MVEQFGLSSVSLTGNTAPEEEVTVFTSYKIVDQPDSMNIIPMDPNISAQTATAIEIPQQMYNMEDTEDLTLQLILGSEKIKFCPVCGKHTKEISQLSSHLGRRYPVYFYHNRIFSCRKLPGKGEREDN